VGAVHHPLAHDDRCARRRGEHDQVGVVDRVTRGTKRANLDVDVILHVAHERHAAVFVRTPDANVAQSTHTCEGLEMTASLNAAADDAEYTGVGAPKKID
jgi:hypothetical protein